MTILKPIIEKLESKLIKKFLKIKIFTIRYTRKCFLSQKPANLSNMK